MQQRIALTALIVRDYDEAIQFYTEKLNFELLEDTQLSESKRWVRVAPKGSSESAILLAKASNEKQLASVGNQTGGRVFLFLHTDDFWRDYHQMVANEVNFITSPRTEPYGIVAVFEDLYGTKWDMIQPVQAK